MKKICPNKIKEIINRKRLIVDVRENFEYQNYRIDVQNMTNIPLSDIEQRINEFPNDREIILVCNNGLRSSMALKFLEQRGFNNLRYIEGGIVKWIQNSLKIIGNAPDIVSHSLSLDKTCEK